MGMGMTAASPLGNIGRYFLDSLIGTARLDPSSVITAWRRDETKYEKLFKDLKDQGWTDDRIEALKFFTLLRLDPRTITQIYNRDRPKWDKLWKDLADQGWTEDRIDIYKELANIVPPLADMVRFADFGSRANSGL
ncbi:unnamed protein product, partial [marine sediment metagenome]